MVDGCWWENVPCGKCKWDSIHALLKEWIHLQKWMCTKQGWRKCNTFLYQPDSAFLVSAVAIEFVRLSLQEAYIRNCTERRADSVWSATCTLCSYWLAGGSSGGPWGRCTELALHAHAQDISPTKVSPLMMTEGSGCCQVCPRWPTPVLHSAPFLQAV